MRLLGYLTLFTVVYALDLASLGDRRLPHAVQIHKRGLPAGVPADIQVADSNTSPIEDLVTPPGNGAGANGNINKNQDTAQRISHMDAPSVRASSQGSAAEQGGASGQESTDSNAFFMSISMIIVSEIGDKTFLISALMAMRHSRIVVFTASFASLAIMTILSGIVGHTLPTLLSKRVTQFLAAVLFLVFGYKLTREGLAMSKDLGVDEELAEVEEELTVSDMNNDLDTLETGGHETKQNPNRSFQELVVDSVMSVLHSFKELSSFVLSPLWVQVFVMIFLGEWGDRSQIATIAMAAGSNYWLVIMGAVIGHGICTAGAVIGGKMLASRISMRTVTLGGAFAFLIFSILYFYDAIYNIE